MSLVTTFSRLHFISRRISTSPCLFAEPLKKKKKIDPAIIKQREERKRKKLEKQIRRLEKNARQLKPIEELEIPIELLEQMKERTRYVTALSSKELEDRALLAKSWTRYKHQEKTFDFQIIDRLLQSQSVALEELRQESEHLYDAAIQCDTTLLPFKSKGPVFTPPIESFNSPDGDYIYKTKKWDK